MLHWYCKVTIIVDRGDKI